MSESSNSSAALVPIDQDWRPIFNDSNQIVLYNPTSHSLQVSVKPRPPCPYCKQTLPPGFALPFSHPEHRDTYEDNTTRASNYFHLLAIANESSTSPTRASSSRSSDARTINFEQQDEQQDSSRGRTAFPKGTMADGYFNAFFKEECKLGMGVNGSVYLCQVCIARYVRIC
jgi:hypothetical protein